MGFNRKLAGVDGALTKEERDAHAKVLENTHCVRVGVLATEECAN
jgi:hypothetical protein